MIINNTHLNEINSPKQTIKASVELYNGSTLVKECTCADILSEFQIERGGEGKFFGYGICQKLIVALADINKEIDENIIDGFEINFIANEDTLKPFPRFHKDAPERDQATNLLKFSAYDCLYQANSFTFTDLWIEAPYTIQDVAAASADIIGASGLRILGVEDDIFSKSYNGINVSGEEKIRAILNAVAEATQTIYYIDKDNCLCFKRLDTEGEPAYTINQNQYFTLTTNGGRILSDICAVTALGDNVITDSGTNGTIQYVRDNPFWDVEEDIGAVLDSALTAIGHITINEFECNWMGNYLLEIGDKIALIGDGDSSIISYILDETIDFNGTLSQLTKWSYSESDTETAANPSTLGDILKQTTAKVDKVAQEITLTVATIQGDIAANEQANQEQFQALETKITQTAENVKIDVKQEIKEAGAEKVVTATGFTFDNDGLTISKSGSDITTTISEDGMQVYKDSDEVLTADNEGVKATDLHARTYIWIGAYSRLENYGTNRTGCFYVGG